MVRPTLAERSLAAATNGRRPPAPRHPEWWHALAATLIVAVFLLDLASTRLTVPVLYVLPALLFVWSGLLSEPLAVAAVATVLTAAGFYVSPAGRDPFVDGVNRLIAVSVIWTTAGLVAAYLRGVGRWSDEIADTTRALGDSMRRLQDIQHALDQSAIVAATDQRGLITYVNDKFCEISGYSRDELVGQDHRIVNSGYHPKEFIRDIWRTIARGQVWRGELRNKAKNGSIYWVDTTIVPFLDGRGKPWQYLSIRNDITQRKAAEERLRDEAALTQLGRLSAVVAHEVRNPLAGLKGSLQVLASRLPPDFQGRDIITPMLARIDALNGTVQDILTYSRPSQPKLQAVNACSTIREVVNSARSVFRSTPVEIAAEPLVVRADPEMLHAVLLNLLLNACHASGDQPVLVRAEGREGRCEIAILDRGPGLPQSVRAHLFEPFVTTRSDGTGLGLPIARRLTLLQGGSLTLLDRPECGTIALVSLTAAPTTPGAG